MNFFSRLFVPLGLALSLSAVAAVEESESTVLTDTDIMGAYQANPEDVLQVLQSLLVIDGIDTQRVLQTAFELAPELAQEISEIARVAGIASEDVTTAALLSGVDPTQIGDATAAGISSIALSPPAIPAVGSDGGGGSGVISPN
ncbi:hypothetical protein [Vibrio sp. VPAP30]|uniref:hypothetical protein n=1 Tax=Vibrio sp. VPAP30 TaxID=1647102 RepID=UPI000659CAA3|nr:hypothetical protein [Vibrio sp. VPAP30]KLN63539.1 hypothetical protein ZX61_18595 [Vibrio sp. VPAP30]